MKTAYVVTDGEYSDYCILQVFSSREKAKEANELRTQLIALGQWKEGPIDMLQQQITQEKDKTT